MSDRRPGSRGWFGFGRAAKTVPVTAPVTSAVSSATPALANPARANPGPATPGLATPGPAAPAGEAGAAPVSPVTDAARAAVLAVALPAEIPPGAAPDLVIDALGRKCPIPIIMLAGRIQDVPVGSVIAVLADDPAAYSDVPAWCALKSHDCVFRVSVATGWSFGVRRGY